MADIRGRIGVKIIDPTTDTNEAAVDASGNLQVGIGAVTAAAGNIAKVEDAAHVSADVGVAVLAVRRDTAAVGSNADGDYSTINVDANGKVWVNAEISGPLEGDDGSIAASLNSLRTVNLLYGFDGTAWERIHTDTGNRVLVSGQAADGAAVAGNPVRVGGKDGSGNTQDIITDTDGHLQVDILSGAGADTPTNPTVDVASSSGTAAGAEANLDSSEITEAEKLHAVDVSASVPFKFRVLAVENTVERALTNLMFGRANERVRWVPPHPDFATHAGASGGTDVFRVEAFNMDNSQAADLHASFYYST